MKFMKPYWSLFFAFLAFGCATASAPPAPQATFVPPAPSALAPEPVITPDGVEFSHLGVSIHPLEWAVRVHKLAVVPEGESAVTLVKDPATISLRFFRGKTVEELVFKEAARMERELLGGVDEYLTGSDGRFVGVNAMGVYRDDIWMRSVIFEPLKGTDLIVRAALHIPRRDYEEGFQRLLLILSKIKPLHMD